MIYHRFTYFFMLRFHSKLDPATGFSDPVFMTTQRAYRFDRFCRDQANCAQQDVMWRLGQSWMGSGFNESFSLFVSMGLSTFTSQEIRFFAGDLRLAMISDDF